MFNVSIREYFLVLNVFIYVYVIQQCSNQYPFCALTYTRPCLVQCTPRGSRPCFNPEYINLALDRHSKRWARSNSTVVQQCNSWSRHEMSPQRQWVRSKCEGDMDDRWFAYPASTSWPSLWPEKSQDWKKGKPLLCEIYRLRRRGNSTPATPEMVQWPGRNDC